MTEVAGLVLSVATLWKSCVQVYEVVQSARNYGQEYVVLSTKFEIERVRLLRWGETIGLGDCHIHPELYNKEVCSAVFDLLGCIQHVFEDANRLQHHYGLRPLDHAPVAGKSEVIMWQSQHILGGVFKRAYDRLRWMGDERQRGTPLARKAKWAVRDCKKFEALIIELRNFNNSLLSLFPDAPKTIVKTMRGDIDAATDVDELRLLQEAIGGDYEELSEQASLRLETLSATVSSKFWLPSEVSDETDSQGTARNTAVEAPEDNNERSARDSRQSGSQAPATEAMPEKDELSRQIAEVESFIQKRIKGGLSIDLAGPYTFMPCVSTSLLSWNGHNRESKPSYQVDSYFTAVYHASFAMYKRKKYMTNWSRNEYEPDTEDDILLDPESHVNYENVSPGTVTVEGYALECWQFEEMKPREISVVVSYADLPVLPARKILRRIDELQNNPPQFYWDSLLDELDLREIVGKSSFASFNLNPAQNPGDWIGTLYRILNRRDTFVDFQETPSIAPRWSFLTSDTSYGALEFLRQVIITRELAIRLKRYNAMSYNGFTYRILTTLIISELWLEHVRIVLSDKTDGVNVSEWKKADTPAQKGEAEGFKKRGNNSLREKEYQRVVDLYTEAIKIDNDAIYYCNRSAAFIGLENYLMAEQDAFIATLLKPKYAKAWSRRGMAILKLGQPKRAKKAYEKALELAGKEATLQMRQGLANAQSKISEVIDATNSETDVAKKHSLRADILDEDWEVYGKQIELHSLIHEQQVEGLLLFAERMKWPYINEVRNYAEDVYSDIRCGEVFNHNLIDWLYGVMLPGKWFSYKIMTALLLCTPSANMTPKVTPWHDAGISLLTQSYWRLRTVLARVLGCLPGVISLGGWVGPCPRMEFDPPLPAKRARYIRIKARGLALIHPTTKSGKDFGIYDRIPYHAGTRICPDEETQPYLAEMRDPSNWIIPEPPIHDVGTCDIKSIQLKNLGTDISVAQKASRGELHDLDMEYRASITFAIDNNQSPITYKLFTNPVFVTLPPCLPGPRGPHEVHLRELPRFQKHIWPIERLQDHTPEDSHGGEVMVINATGRGAEVLARAWCSERGKNAAIRHARGPCFVCAVRAADQGSLGTGVLIWTD